MANRKSISTTDKQNTEASAAPHRKNAAQPKLSDSFAPVSFHIIWNFANELKLLRERFIVGHLVENEGILVALIQAAALYDEDEFRSALRTENCPGRAKSLAIGERVMMNPPGLHHLVENPCKQFFGLVVEHGITLRLGNFSAIHSGQHRLWSEQTHCATLGTAEIQISAEHGGGLSLPDR